MVEIPCTTQTCTTGMVCCVHEFNDNLDHCSQPGTCDRGYVEVGCNGPMDCAQSEVCCGAFNQNEGYQLIACVPNCQNTSTTVGILMCGDDPNACDGQQSCYPSGFLPSGHSFCQ